MFNVSIREYFSVLNVFIVCICNTAVFKLIPLLCTHVYSYMFSTVLPRVAMPSEGRLPKLRIVAADVEPDNCESSTGGNCDVE
jgi:hypothetical protein